MDLLNRFHTIKSILNVTTCNKSEVEYSVSILLSLF